MTPPPSVLSGSQPGISKTWRDGVVICGAKSDTGDALVIAKYPRLRHHRLHPVTPCSAQTKAVRTVVHTRDDVVAIGASASNQLSTA